MEDFAFPDPQQGTNLVAPDRPCDTCDGDRFVVVSRRRPAQTAWMDEHELQANVAHLIDEYAPCPSCSGGTNTAFRRSDGRLIQCPDPAMTRKMMTS